MNIFSSKGAMRLFLTIRPLLVIGVLIGFFFFYNLFMVDRSLESLRFSLSTIAGAETVGSVSYVAPLMQIQFIDGLLSDKLNTEDLMRLQYSADVIGTSHAERGVADVASVMQGVINKKEKERYFILQFFDKINSFIMILFKKVPAWRIKEVEDLPIDSATLAEINSYENKGEFDETIRLYRETIAKFPNYAQTPALMLRLGYLLHRLGRFEEAKLVYNEVIDRFPTMAESKVARTLLDKVEERENLDKKAREIINKITLAADKQTRQKLYYELGLMEFSALSLKKAKEGFKRAIFLLPDTDITAQSYLRLGICERLLGDINASMEAFKKASEITKSAELKTQSQYQLAQSYRQKGDYEGVTSALDNIAMEQENKQIKSLLLFQKGSTLLYDEKDVSKAKQVFDELMRRYSAQALVSAGTETSFVEFVKKHANLDIISRKPEELEKLLEKAWIEALLPKKIFNIIESNSTRVINSLNLTVEEIAKLKEKALEEGAYIQIALTEDEVNRFIESALLAGERIAVREMSVKFEGEQRLSITVTIYQKERPIKVYVYGEFKMVSISSVPYWVTAAKRRNLLIFLVENAKIANIPVPPDIINPLFRPALENFNESFPLDLEEFRLDRNTMMLAGSVRPDYIRRLKATPTAGQLPSKKTMPGFLRELSVKKLRKSG